MSGRSVEATRKLLRAAAQGGRRWTRREYQSDATTLAQRLLGQLLVRIDPETGERLSGVIVETEAYLGVEDKAAHSVGGRRTQRNEPMYGPAGTLYVYFTYGMHHCANIVAGDEGEPVAVLLRAVEPVEGIERMRERRLAKRDCRGRTLPLRDLCSGPAKLCQALALDRRLSGASLLDPACPLWVERGAQPAPSLILRTPRVGVGYAQEWAAKPLRFLLQGAPSVSRPSPSRMAPVAGRA